MKVHAARKIEDALYGRDNLCGHVNHRHGAARPNEKEMTHRVNYKKRSYEEKSGHMDGPRLAPSGFVRPLERLVRPWT